MGQSKLMSPLQSLPLVYTFRDYYTHTQMTDNHRIFWFCVFGFGLIYWCSCFILQFVVFFIIFFISTYSLKLGQTYEISTICCKVVYLNQTNAKCTKAEDQVFANHMIMYNNHFHLFIFYLLVLYTNNRLIN